MKPLSILPVRTPIFRAGESISDFVASNISAPREDLIIAVTSKIVSLAENRLVEKLSIEKSVLVKREADHNLGAIGYGSLLTIKEGLLIASAGIDESNSETGDYILYPEKPFESARLICESLRARWQIKNVGILLTDSRTSPLRFGVTGVALAYWGFRGLQNKVGSRDLFNRELQMTKINYADGLASAATLVMGEGNESRPLAVISGADVEFVKDTDPNEIKTRLEDDLYYPFLKLRIESP